MFNLHTGVHFNEVELAVLVQKFKSTGTPVRNFLAGGNAALTNPLDQLARNARGWGFFNDFLVAPLHRAIALAQVNRVFKFVGQDLDLNVPGVLQEFFQVHRWVAKSCLRLCFGRGHGIHQGRLGVHHPHATAATAPSGLDDHRVAHSSGDPPNLDWVARQFPLRTGHTGHTGLDHGLLGRDLVTHDANRLRRRPDKLKAAFLNSLGKICVFAQKTVARMDRLGVGDFRSRNNGRHIEVAQGRRRRADAHRFFSQLDILGLAVCL